MALQVTGWPLTVQLTLAVAVGESGVFMPLSIFV
jgi:hypothetical protein